MKANVILAALSLAASALTGCGSVAETMISIPFALVSGSIEAASDSRAEKRYIKEGATPSEAKQRVFEDDFFKDVGGRP